jgi:hypothetical protein
MKMPNRIGLAICLLAIELRLSMPHPLIGVVLALIFFLGVYLLVTEAK